MLSTNHCPVRLQPPACTGARPSLPTTTNVVPIPVLLAHSRVVAQRQARQETQLTTCNVGVVLQPRFPGRYSRVAAHPCHACTLSHAQQLWRPSTYSIVFRRGRVTFVLDKTWRCPPSVCPFARQVSDGIMNIGSKPDSPEGPGTETRFVHANMHQKRLSIGFVEQCFGHVLVQTAQRRQQPSCSFHVTCREHWQQEKAHSRTWVSYI
jgi:hypothetical protein